MAEGRSVRGEGPVTLREIRVAFFRNLNLGQARSHSPTSAQLLDAFVEVGARSPSHVGTNSTVVYNHSTGPTLVRRVAKLLTPMCGYRDMVTVRSGAALIELDRRLRGLGDGEVTTAAPSPSTVPAATPRPPTPSSPRSSASPPRQGRSRRCAA